MKENENAREGKASQITAHRFFCFRASVFSTFFHAEMIYFSGAREEPDPANDFRDTGRSADRVLSEERIACVMISSHYLKNSGKAQPYH